MENIASTIDSIQSEMITTLSGSNENCIIQLNDLSRNPFIDINSVILTDDFYAAYPKPAPYEEVIKISYKF